MGLTPRAPPPFPLSDTSRSDAVSKGALAGRLQLDRTARLLLHPSAPASPRMDSQSKTANVPHDAAAAAAAATSAAANAYGLPNPGLEELGVAQLRRPHEAAHDPEFLKKLLHFVRQELRHANPASGTFIDDRLGVFRRVFGHFIAANGSYAPLLLAVQEAYERALYDARARSSGVDALSERLALMQDEARQLLAALRADHAAEREMLMTRIGETETRVHAANGEVGELRQEVQRLSAELAKSQRQVHEMELKNVELGKSVELWTGETMNARRQAQAEMHEMMKLRQEVREMKLRETTLINDDLEMKKELHEVKSAYDELVSATVPKEAHKLSIDTVARTQVELRTMKQERDELTRLLAGGESRLMYPNGLDWAADSTAGVLYLDPGWRGQRVGAVVGRLVRDIVALHSALEVAKAAAGGAAGGAAGALALPPPLFSLESNDEYGDFEPTATGAEAAEVLFEGSASAPPQQLRKEDKPVSELLLRGRVSELGDKGGSSFGGLIRLRPEQWPLEEVRGAVRRLWHDLKRKLASMPGGLNGKPTIGSEGVTAMALQELVAAFLTQRHQALEEAAAASQAVYTAAEAAVDAASRGRRPGGYGGVSHTKKPMHRGLLCADTYNLHAAMWRRRDREPQASIFLMVCLGRLPAATFAEVHKALTSLHRTVTAAATKERVPLTTVLEKLPSVLLGASAAQRNQLVRTLQRESGGVSAESIKVEHFEPAPKDPCDGHGLSPAQCEVQRVFLWMALTLRDEVEASVRRSALAFLLETRHPNAPVSHAGLPGGGEIDNALQLEARQMSLPPHVLRAALLRVDAATPEHALTEMLTRVYGAAALKAIEAAQREQTWSPEAAAKVEALMADLDLPLEQLLARLFAEPLRRFSARTDTDLAGQIEADLRKAHAKASKASKGKGKTKGGASTVAGVPRQLLKEAILKVDGARPRFEAEWLASRCVDAARAASASTEGLAAAVQAMPPDQAPLEPLIYALQQELVQPTSPRVAITAPTRPGSPVAGSSAPGSPRTESPGPV